MMMIRKMPRRMDDLTATGGTCLMHSTYIFALYSISSRGLGWKDGYVFFWGRGFHLLAGIYIA